MSIQDLMGSVSDRLSTEATVRRVFGEPITVGERTVIPVARVGYGFGAGMGSSGEAGEDGGGGGGMSAWPAGVIELTEDGMDYVEFGLDKKIATAALVGLAVGFLLAKLGRR